MSNLPITPTADLLWESQSPSTLTVSPEQIQKAIRWSQPIADLEQQWQVYLNGLALLGCEQWLHHRAPELPISDGQCSIHQPIYASLINAVCHLQVGAFKVCVLAIGSLTDTQFSLPRAVLDLPKFAAHWYVWVEVLEESEAVRVHGCLSYDRLSQLPLAIESDWHYTLPLQQTLDPDALLLGLRCLDPQAMALPAPSVELQSQTKTTLQNKIAAVLPQLRSQKRTLWQVLTWDEGATLFQSSDLMNWFASELMPASLGRTVINAAFWLREQLDSTAQALSLMLMPSTMSAFRSGRGLDSVRADLSTGGIDIPAEARGTYQDLQWENLDLRLYTIVWTIAAASPDRSGDHEWVLLLVLGGQPNARPPFGVKLEVSDRTEVLVEEVLEERSNNSYLYAQVMGGWNEKFQMTLSFNQSTITTLVYEFEPERI
jgi:Protein of unknown function (DUF1822)